MVAIVCSSNYYTYAYVCYSRVQNSDQKWQGHSKGIWYWPNIIIVSYLFCIFIDKNNFKKILFWLINIFNINNVWVNKTKTNHSTVSLLQFVSVFLTQTLKTRTVYRNNAFNVWFFFSIYWFQILFSFGSWGDNLSQKSVLESIKCSSDFSDSTDKVFWGHSTTMWTKFYPILTIYRPWVDDCRHFTQYLYFVQETIKLILTIYPPLLVHLVIDCPPWDKIGG